MKKIILLIMIFLSTYSYAQEENSEESEKGTHRISLALDHANVSQGVSESGSKWLSLPAWSLDYDYWLSDKWAIGLHTDIITENFEVKANLSEEDETLERSTPVAPAAVVIYKATKHSSFLFGVGGEFAKEENLFLNRVGYEWGTKITENWELGLTACYDIRWNAYDSFLIGIGISRKFKPKHKM